MRKLRESVRRVWRNITATKPPASPEMLAGLEQHEPPYTTTPWFTAPKFGAAGSGGLEYERLPEAHTNEAHADDRVRRAA